MNEQRTPTVLVVDDERDTCANLHDILTDLGYEVDVAFDGPSAIEMIQRKAYDVALLDLRMPGMNGLDLYRRMKRIRSGTVAVIVTAYSTSETAEQALQAGAWQVLPKPVNLAALIKVVEEAIEQPTVLVVDDDRDLCDNLWDLLRDRGFRVCIANSGTEAVERLHSKEYRLVLIDLKLPEGDGSSVFTTVRATCPLARTIIVTGHRTDMDEVVQRAVQGAAFVTAEIAGRSCGDPGLCCETPLAFSDDYVGARESPSHVTSPEDGRRPRVGGRSR